MGEWSNGLFGCFANCGVCLITYIVPCVTAGRNAEAVGEGCFLYGLLAILGPIGIWSRAKIRGKIRDQKGIDVSIFNFSVSSGPKTAGRINSWCCLLLTSSSTSAVQAPGVSHGMKRRPDRR